MKHYRMGDIFKINPKLHFAKIFPTYQNKYVNICCFYNHILQIYQDEMKILYFNRFNEFPKIMSKKTLKNISQNVSKKFKSMEIIMENTKKRLNKKKGLKSNLSVLTEYYIM